MNKTLRPGSLPWRIRRGAGRAWHHAPRVLAVAFALAMILLPQGAAVAGPPVPAEEVQQAIQREGLDWQAGTYDREFALGLIPGQVTDEAVPQAEQLPPQQIPTAVNWRDHNGNYVSPIKNQGSCGSCWAFASVAGLESEWAISHKTPGSFLNLSEQQLVSCETHSSGCGGGYISTAAAYLKSTGVANESCFPYTASNQPCSNRCANWASQAKKISSYASAGSSVNALKSALVSAPVVVSFQVFSDFYYNYKSGVYEKTSGAYSKGWHAVLAVGYKDVAGKYGGGYFIVKNSWDKTWGENGYFRIGYSQWGNEVQFGREAYLYHIPDTGGGLQVSKKLALSPNPVAPGKQVTATFTVKNTGTKAITVQALKTEVHLSSWSGSAYDFAATGSFTLKPGATRTYSASRSFSSAGTYLAEPRAKIGGKWVKIDGGNRVTLTVGSAWKPKPGYWRGGAEGAEGTIDFYVTADSKSVKTYRAYYYVPACKTWFWSWTNSLLPISSSKTFSLTGTLYGSGTFTSATAATVTAGLKNRDLTYWGCGYVTKAPWSRTAKWVSATLPAASDGSGGATDQVVKKAP